MTAHVLITGELFRAPEARTSNGGNAYTTATIAVRDGADKTFWRLRAFSETAQAELLRLRVGEALSAQGKLAVNTYQKDGQTRVSYEMIANVVVALRQPPKERAKKAATDAVPPADTRSRDERVRGIADPDLNDDPPW